MSGRTKYVIYDYKVRDFTFPAPGIALMAGKVHIKSDTGGNINDAILVIPAVWREEQGSGSFWRGSRANCRRRSRLNSLSHVAQG